jgi:hypothetical protein
MATMEAPSPTPTGDVDMEESRAAAGGEDVEEMLGDIEPEVVKRITFLEWVCWSLFLGLGKGELEQSWGEKQGWENWENWENWEIRGIENFWTEDWNF